MLPPSPDKIMSESIETFWKEFESLATQKTEQDTTVAPWIVREQVKIIMYSILYTLYASRTSPFRTFLIQIWEGKTGWRLHQSYMCTD